MKPETVVPLKFQSGIFYPNTFLGSNRFSFLNIQNSFLNIDWNFAENGKLWTYNLNYFEFLNQEKITKEHGLKLIQDYISKKEILKDGLEPYPISLRGINWVKFLAQNEIKNEEINGCLFQDYSRLSENLEYHLLANHLLENGFSLLFGAHYFKNEAFYSKAKQIITSQLKEQILNDGAHYELSPMYHQIILHRVLDCVNLVGENSWKGSELEDFLKIKAEKMLGWLEEISFKNGDIPKLNDAANGIAPNTKELNNYAESLGIKASRTELGDSSYRKFEINNLEILMDVGQIAPSYQPGHSHADSLQFLLTYNNKPIIVDTGISTYEKNERRQLERSTASHNTVTINDLNSSEVWGGFRVANRAKVSIIRDEEDVIEARHNGYRKLGIEHQRSFVLSSGAFEITDMLKGKTEDLLVVGHLHFHPGIQPEILNDKIILGEELQLKISGAKEIRIEDYQFAEAFNRLIPAKKIEYTFTNKAELVFHAKSATE